MPMMASQTIKKGFKIDFELLKGVMETIEYLKSLKIKNIDELNEKVSVYNTDGESYCDFYYSPELYDFAFEGCFCLNQNGEFELSTNATILDDEQNVLLEIKNI